MSDEAEREAREILENRWHGPVLVDRIAAALQRRDVELADAQREIERLRAVVANHEAAHRVGLANERALREALTSALTRQARARAAGWQTGKERDEVWAEEPGLSVRVEHHEAQVIITVIDYSGGTGPDVRKELASATLTPARWARIVAAMEPANG